MGRQTVLTMLGENTIMCRWRSSLWKLIWRDLMLYTVLFLIIMAIYRSSDEEKQKTFEKVARWFKDSYTSLPLTFLLGFYVSLVVRRWWEQYNFLPWPDSLAYGLRGLVTEGDQDQCRMIRRTVVRYCLLSYVLCLRRVSSRFRRRFPTIKAVIRTGLVRPDEAALIGAEDSGDMYDTNWNLPLKWATELCSKAVSDQHMKFAVGYLPIQSDIAKFRAGLTKVETYGHIPVPLVYTQVVTLAVYIYFAVSLVGEQWLILRPKSDGATKMMGDEMMADEIMADEMTGDGMMAGVKYIGDELQLYYPIFMTMKFLFYFGWLKVAETLFNPFGEDDDDFRLNELIQRHLSVAMNIVDEQVETPALEKDIFWDETDPVLRESEENIQDMYNLTNRQSKTE